MSYSIYIVDADDFDNFDISFDEVISLAVDSIFDEDLQRLFYEYIKRTNDRTIHSINCLHFLCDDTNGIILAS